MSNLPRVLLVNPSMTPARNARFPLAILNLASALEGPFAGQHFVCNDAQGVLVCPAVAGKAGRLFR